jgi:hypothetical protein
VLRKSQYKSRRRTEVFFAANDRKRFIADNLSKADSSWGCVATLDSNGRTIFVVDAHRDDGRRFVVRADEKLTAFVELESAILAAEPPEDCGARKIKLDNCRDDGKSLLDFVIRQFERIFGTAE